MVPALLPRMLRGTHVTHVTRPLVLQASSGRTGRSGRRCASSPSSRCATWASARRRWSCASRCEPRPAPSGGCRSLGLPVGPITTQFHVHFTHARTHTIHTHTHFTHTTHARHTHAHRAHNILTHTSRTLHAHPQTKGTLHASKGKLQAQPCTPMQFT